MNWDSLKGGLTKAGIWEETEAKPAVLKQPAATAYPNIHASGAIIVTDDIDPHFVAALRDAASKSTVPGFEEFENQLEALREDEPDEGKRIRLASKSTAAAHKGLTPQKIVDSLRDRMRLLDSEYQETEAGFAKQSDSQVGAKEAAIKALEAKIALAKQEIDNLQQQKTAAETEVLTLKQRIGTAQSKFEAAYKTVKAEYDGILSKVSAILK